MKILVIGPSWVGDMMMSQSLYHTLKVEYPDAEIDVMAPAWCYALVNRMSEVNNALLMPFSHGVLAIGERYRLGMRLREQHYSRAYVLPNSFKSALVPFFASIQQRTGWRGEMRYGLLNDLRILDKKAFPLMVQRYVALAYDAQRVLSAADFPHPLFRPQLQVNASEVAATAKIVNLMDNRPVIGFCPGAEFGPAKRWPHYHYARLAEQLIDERGSQVVLFGSAHDKDLAESIREAVAEKNRRYCLNLTGLTSLEQAINLIAACSAIVTNDSGLMHIAAALDKPLVALYGPSSPDFTPPLSDKARIIRLVTGYHRVRRGKADEGYHQSLIDIQPDSVIAALDALSAGNC